MGWLRRKKEAEQPTPTLTPGERVDVSVFAMLVNCSPHGEDVVVNQDHAKVILHLIRRAYGK